MKELTTVEPGPGATTSARWRAGVQTGRVEPLIELLHPDVVLHSPLTRRLPFTGRHRVGELLAAALASVHGIRFHTDTGDGRTRAVVVTGRIGSLEFEETQLLRLDPDGLITEITLFIRPLPALTAIISAIAPRIARQRGKPRLAAVLGPLCKPLEVLARFGDRGLVPLVLRERQDERAQDHA